MSRLMEAFDSLSSRSILLFGGKGGAGKTTIASLAALHFAKTRDTILFTTDPASSLEDLFGSERPPRLTIEKVDAPLLYQRFLEANMQSFLELGDRGTYLDRDELQRFLELSVPGMDELMSWSRIGELHEANPATMLIADTAPTGHTLRMLSSSDHFRQLGKALDSMQAKHRDMVRQLTRRSVRDAMDEFIERFQQEAERRQRVLTDPDLTAFIPICLAEEWVVQQTIRLAAAVEQDGLPVPFVILNQSATPADCALCAERVRREDQAVHALYPREIIRVPRSCTSLDTVAALTSCLEGPKPELDTQDTPLSIQPGAELALPASTRMLFLAGKGGVGKTTSAVSIALQLAHANPKTTYTIISVDPAHTLADIFLTQPPPENLNVEVIDTRLRWKQFRDSLGDEIDRAVAALTPKGLTVAYDTEAMKHLIEIAPPGADELFAINRLAELEADQSQAMIIVDTAPTGHFLRLLDLPKTADEWVREFIRILLRYRDLISPGSLGEELIRASKALHALDGALHSERTGVIVVTRAERIVIAETRRLLDELSQRGIAVRGVIANYLTPADECPCDQQHRADEHRALSELEQQVVSIPRRSEPVATLEDLRGLVPIMQTPSA